MITKNAQLTHALYGTASIHVMAAKLQKSVSFNGWDYWQAMRQDGTMITIDSLRKHLRDIKKNMKLAA
jgi:hypothetical protein